MCCCFLFHLFFIRGSSLSGVTPLVLAAYVPPPPTFQGYTKSSLQPTSFLSFWLPILSNIRPIIPDTEFSNNTLVCCSKFTSVFVDQLTFQCTSEAVARSPTKSAVSTLYAAYAADFAKRPLLLLTTLSGVLPAVPRSYIWPCAVPTVVTITPAAAVPPPHYPIPSQRSYEGEQTLSP